MRRASLLSMVSGKTNGVKISFHAQVNGLFGSPVPLGMFLDEIPLPVAVMNLDRRILAMNRAMEALTGFSREEAGGIACYHILRNRICLEGCPALGLEAGSESIRMESDLINRDRRRVPVVVTVGHVRDTEGKIVGFLESVEDIGTLRELDEKRYSAYRFGSLVGKCPQMEKLFQTLPLLSQSNSAVLITGETGTGKDMLAEALHRASNRAGGPFVKVNCGALPETLMESELFGHRKGAFTGAVETKPGRFRLAHNGTLYLTEIGDLPLALQVKLLTFLDDKVIYPLGSTRGFQCDVRVIAATHRNLEQMAREGTFRKDLLFRINVVRLEMPPLRERGDDVRLIMDHFLNSFSKQFGKKIHGFSGKALRILMDYSYPGNVRELRNIIEYAVNMCGEGRIHPRHLPAYLTDRKNPALFPQTLPETDAAVDLPGRWVGEQARTPETWAATERRLILDALVRTRGNRTRAAALLGWGRSTLWRKMKQYEISG